MAAVPILGFQHRSQQQPLPNEGLNTHVFSKHLQFLNYNDMSNAAAEIGFNGLDLTVRRKGHVLPKAVEAMINHGLKPKLMSTNVWDVNDAKNKMVLETASQLGFTHYRTDWLKYPKNASIVESQVQFGKEAIALGTLNENWD